MDSFILPLFHNVPARTVIRVRNVDHRRARKRRMSATSNLIQKNNFYRLKPSSSEAQETPASHFLFPVVRMVLTRCTCGIVCRTSDRASQH